MSGWRVIQLARSLGEHGAAWDALNARLYRDHPLLSSLFVNGLLRHFGNGEEYLCQYHAAGQVQAMCVLHRKNALLWGSFLPSQAQIGATLIDDPALVDSLVRSLPGQALQLDLLCNDPAFGKVLQGAPRGNLLNQSLTIKVDLGGTFAGYWSSRSKQLQSNMKQRDKRLLDDGITQRYVTISDAGQILAAVDRYAALECAGWKGRNGTAVGSNPTQHQFYRDLMHGAAARGEAFVSELWFGDTLASSRLLIQRDAMIVILKTSYDETFASYSPGRLLLRQVIEQAFAANPGGAIEFYTDADQNQLEWASGQRWIQHRTLYRGPITQALSMAVKALKPRAAPLEGLTVTAYHDPQALPPEVQRYINKAEKRNVGFGLSWYTNLVRTVYAKDAGMVRFYVLGKGAQILGVLPLRAEKQRRGWEIGALSNFYTSLYEPVLEPDLKAPEMVLMLDALERDFPRLRSLALAPMDPASHAYQTLLCAMRGKGWIPFEYFAFANWYQPVVSSWEQYLSERSSTLQNTLRRMGKKFAADQGSLQLVTSAKDIPAAIAAYERVYAESWKKPEPFPLFMPGLLQTCATKGFLRLGIAWLDGQPVAAQLWIVSHGRAEIYKLAYDERFKAYSPGTLLTAMLMRHVIEVDKVSEVDYLIGDDPYKKTWMSHQRTRWGLIAYNPRSLFGLAGLAQEAAGRALKNLGARLLPGREHDSESPRAPLNG